MFASRWMWCATTESLRRSGNVTKNGNDPMWFQIAVLALWVIVILILLGIVNALSDMPIAVVRRSP
jgi:hypothetical protein